MVSPVSHRRETRRRQLAIARWVRQSDAIRTHIFCALQAEVKLELMRSEKLISNWYEVQRNLFKNVVREYILENLINAVG